MTARVAGKPSASNKEIDKEKIAKNKAVKVETAKIIKAVKVTKVIKNSQKHKSIKTVKNIKT